MNHHISQKSRHPLPITLLAGALLLAIGAPLLAVDGVIEINHTRALAGGVVVGDAPGYPVTIDQSGSYRLTSNLTAPDENTTVIELNGAAEHSTVDLNGFSIIGPAVCSGSGVDLRCVPVGTGNGINLLVSHVTIKNGFIRGVGGSGIDGSSVSGIQIVEVFAVENAGANGVNGAGIDLRGASEVSIVNCQIARNGAKGAWLGPGAEIRGSLLIDNRDMGTIIWGNGANVRGNVFKDNGTSALLIQDAGNGADGATIVGNTFSGNMKGIDLAGTAAGYAANAFADNTNGAVSGSPVEIGANVCNGDLTCP